MCHVHVRIPCACQDASWHTAPTSQLVAGLISISCILDPVSGRNHNCSRNLACCTALCTYIATVDNHSNSFCNHTAVAQTSLALASTSIIQDTSHMTSFQDFVEIYSYLGPKEYSMHYVSRYYLRGAEIHHLQVAYEGCTRQAG